MSLKFIILFTVIFVLFLLNRVYVHAEEKRKKSRQGKTVPTDREIIALLDDPLTGEKVTLSENFGNADDIDDGLTYEGNHRTSEKVLNKYATQDGNLEHQFHLIKNYLLDIGFIFKKFSASEITLLEASQLLSGFEDWTYAYSYHKDNLSIFISFVVSTNKRTKGGAIIEDTSICFWLRDFRFYGHYCFYRKNMVDNLASLFQSAKPELKEGYQTIILKKSGNEKELSQFLENLQFDGDLEIEVHDSNVFIRITNLASLENVIKLYQVISPQIP